jgi:hypothetical protein
MTTMHGFELLREQQIPELNTLARLYRHAATGAELLSLVNDDENKVFGITLRTPPADSTGIAHILEHAVLCGSRKYPLKEPFVELLKGSLQTFLNAMTYPDKTCYPVASQNLQDFYNLVDVYLDAVLYPLITPDTLKQEGWHYEVAGDKLVYKGVVYNEMKGAYSSPDTLHYRAVQQSLFPDNAYGVDSGGNPANIPDLTYDQFKAFHTDFYHPSNARVFFYGDDPEEERLRLIDAAFSEFARRNVDSSIPLQQPFREPRRVERSYPAGQSGAAKAMVALNWLMPDPVDAQQSLTLAILEHILLGTSASPLRKALIDSGLGENLTGSGFGELHQWYFTVGLKGVAAEHIGAVEELIQQTLARLAEGGIDPQTIEASVNTIEFRLRENNSGGYPRGLVLMLRSLDTWLYGDDPIAPLAFEAPLATIKARLAHEARYFEGLIARLILNNPHRTTVVLRPDPEQGKREAAAEQERLAQARATMNAEDLERIAEEAERLRAAQEALDPPEAVAKLPSLTLADIDRAIKTTPTALSEIGTTRALYHELFTNRIIYLDIGMNVRTLPQEFLPYVTLFGRALLETGTESESSVQLTQRIGRATGGIWTQHYTSAVRGKSVGTAWLFLRGKAMPEQAGEMLAIMRDVLRTARLDNQERFRQIVLEEKASREAGLVPGGHTVVNGRLRAQFNEADWAGEQISGVSYLQFLRRLIQAVEEEWPTVQAVLEQIRTVLVNRNALICNITTDAEGWAAFEPELAAFLDRLPAGSVTPAAWAPRRPPEFEGLTIPAQVNYVGKGADLYRLGYELHGSALVITRYLRTSYLWDKIRVQGGAYGGFCAFDNLSGVFSYLSYRDPNLLATLKVYDETSRFLRELALNETELSRAIIGAISDLDSYQLPDARGFSAMLRILNGTTDEDRQRIRNEVLDTSAADFRAFADVLDRVRDEGRIVVLGGEETIGAANAELGEKLEVSRLL